MPVKSRFNRLDAFSKTVEDARIRTNSGGLITIVSLLVILWLLKGEWHDYRRITAHQTLIVDKGRGEKMEIHMNITFPHMPCDLLTLDVMDVSGEVQSGVMHGVKQIRLTPASEGGHEIETRDVDLHAESATHLDPNYCGSCWGADPPPHATKPGCCNTCEEVRWAYEAKTWSFGRGEHIEQCEREHFAEHLDEQRKEGCRVEGGIRVNKVVGNFHFAPGHSFSANNMHIHDLDAFRKSKEKHNFSHKIHHLRFGPALPQSVLTKLGGRSGMAWTNHHLNPLDDTTRETEEMEFNYMYFIKVVSTAYLPLGWDKDVSKWSGHDEDIPHELIELGMYGHGTEGSIETHQFSVTGHERPLAMGDDAKEGHPERVHAASGIPGVFFSYDISPMKVIHKEQRNKSFSAFMVGVCAAIGGTLTVAAAIDRSFYTTTSTWNKLKEK